MLTVYDNFFLKDENSGTFIVLQNYSLQLEHIKQKKLYLYTFIRQFLPRVQNKCHSLTVTMAIKCKRTK